MYTGTLTADLLLGDVHSLKGKGSVVRPIVAELRRRFAVAAAEVGDQDLHRRVQIGVATVAGETGQARGFSRISHVSMRSPSWMSLKEPSPIPHS